MRINERWRELATSRLRAHQGWVWCAFLYQQQATGMAAGDASASTQGVEYAVVEVRGTTGGSALGITRAVVEGDAFGDAAGFVAVPAPVFAGTSTMIFEVDDDARSAKLLGTTTRRIVLESKIEARKKAVAE